MTYNILSRQIRKLQNERWLDYDTARRIAYVQQKNLWRLQDWTFKLNKEWVEWSNLNPAQRALIRKAKYGTWNIDDYVYSNWKVKKRWAKNVWFVE